MMPQWQHGADPIEMLQVDQLVEGLKQKITDDPEFFKKKCKEYFKVSLEFTEVFPSLLSQFKPNQTTLPAASVSVELVRPIPDGCSEIFNSSVHKHAR